MLGTSHPGSAGILPASAGMGPPGGEGGTLGSAPYWRLPLPNRPD